MAMRVQESIQLRSNGFKLLRGDPLQITTALNNPSGAKPKSRAPAPVLNSDPPDPFEGISCPFKGVDFGACTAFCMAERPTIDRAGETSQARLPLACASECLRAAWRTASVPARLPGLRAAELAHASDAASARHTLPHTAPSSR